MRRLLVLAVVLGELVVGQAKEEGWHSRPKHTSDGCWGGPGTCRDTWVPEGVKFNQPFKDYAILVAFYTFIVLTLALRLIHGGIAAICRRYNIAMEDVDRDLPTEACMSLCFLTGLCGWVLTAPFVMDWDKGYVAIDRPIGFWSIATLGIMMAVVYLMELSAWVESFSWLSIVHHALYWMDAAYLMVIVLNPYELFMAWIYVGSTLCECAVYISLTLYHASKVFPSMRQLSRRVTLAQLYITIGHNVLAQTAMLGYLIHNRRYMSGLFKYGFVFSNAVWSLETLYCIHGTSSALVRGGSTSAFVAWCARVTRPIKDLTRCRLGCGVRHQRLGEKPGSVQAAALHGAHCKVDIADQGGAGKGAVVAAHDLEVHMPQQEFDC